jgi:hypothetical protein
MNWTPSAILVALIAIPLTGVWLYLAFLIISSAITNPKVLENIEGLLTALAVLTIPTSMFLNEVVKQWRNEGPGGNGA